MGSAQRREPADGAEERVRPKKKKLLSVSGQWLAVGAPVGVCVRTFPLRAYNPWGRSATVEPAGTSGRHHNDCGEVQRRVALGNECRATRTAPIPSKSN